MAKEVPLYGQIQKHKSTHFIHFAFWKQTFTDVNQNKSTEMEAAYTKSIAVQGDVTAS